VLVVEVPVVWIFCGSCSWVFIIWVLVVEVSIAWVLVAKVSFVQVIIVKVPVLRFLVVEIIRQIHVVLGATKRERVH